MFLSLKDLELRRIEFSVSIPAGEIDFEDQELRQKGPLESAGQAELANTALDEIRVRGHLRAGLEADCDRCLEEAAFAVESDFDVCYRPARYAAGHAHEVELGEAESDIAFYEGEGLELKDVLREQVLLSLPMQRLCREDCQGICAVCGQDRNLKPCECQASLADDRWAALREIH